MQTATAEPGALRSEPLSGLCYRVRVPAVAKARGGVVLLHGFGGNEQSLAALAARVPADLVVCSVRGRLTIGPEQHAWFPVSFAAGVPHIDEAAAEASRLAVIRCLQQLQHLYSFGAARTIVAGFSQGGIISASVALSAPEQVAGFAILSGRILAEVEAQLAPPARLSALRAFIAHGTEDRTLPPVWAERADQRLTALGVSHETHYYPGGHGLSAAASSDFLRWLDAVLK